MGTMGATVLTGATTASGMAATSAAGAITAAGAAGTAGVGAGAAGAVATGTGAIAAGGWGIGAISAVAGAAAGIVVLGADSDGISWDCWKPLFHDTSSAPSNGMPLAEALSHPDIHVVANEVEGLVVQNAWSERFLISPVMLPCGRLAAHASKMES